MRELTYAEQSQVAGGVLPIATGAIGSLLGGLSAGGYYALSHPGTSFSWGGFTYSVATTAASGFLIGSGVSLIAGAAVGAAQGTSVLGVTMIGAGGIIGVTAPLALDEGESKKAGS